MTKKQVTIRRAAEEYADEIKRTFPGAVTEVIPESFEGMDAWIHVELPPVLHDQHDDVMDLTAELNARFDEIGIHLIATVADVEEVAVHG
jgi:hypothetical protein